MEVTGCDTRQRKKLSIKKHGKLSDKLVEERTRNKPCVDLISLYKMCVKGN